MAAPPGFENPPDLGELEAEQGGPGGNGPTPLLVTSEEDAVSSSTGLEHHPQDDLQHIIMALIDFIASRYVYYTE